MLSHEESRTFYDRLGGKQDWQRFYEDPAVAHLIKHFSLASAKLVIEFGCGTGRLAESLMAHHLSGEARYIGIDVSSTMVDLTQTRLARFGPRANLLLTSGETRLDVKSSSCDRFLSTYVMDLLTEQDIRSLVAEVHRVLAPGGLLGLVSLTHGFTPLSRVVEKAWLAVHRIRPALLGGCRPISLGPFVNVGWKILHTKRFVSLGLPSEVLVAEKV